MDTLSHPIRDQQSFYFYCKKQPLDHEFSLLFKTVGTLLINPVVLVTRLWSLVFSRCFCLLQAVWTFLDYFLIYFIYYYCNIWLRNADINVIYQCRLWCIQDHHLTSHISRPYSVVFVQPYIFYSWLLGWTTKSPCQWWIMSVHAPVISLYWEQT